MRQEDVIRVLNEPLSQEPLRSAIPARVAYTGTDGFPRAVPIGFHWDGRHIFVCTPPNAYKVRALEKNPKVALTIDTNAHPPHILLVRGTVSIDIVDGVPSEYLEGARKLVPEQQFQAFESEVRSLYKQMARIAITPEWAKLLDFETTLPSAVEELAMRRESERSGSSPQGS